MLTIKLAFRNLFRNTRRTVLTVMMIGFSLAALIITDGVRIGLVKSMTDSITDILNGEAQVQRRDFLDTFNVDLYLKDSDRLEQVITADSNVRSFAPRVISGGMVTSSYNVASGFVYGVDAERELTVSRISLAVTQGSYLTGAPGEILLGSALAETLEVGLGDRIVVTLTEAGTGELVQALFRVSGILNFGVRELDSAFVFINIDKARELLLLGDNSHQIILRFKDPEVAADPNLPIYKALNSEDNEAISWLQANPEISSILAMSSYASLVIGAILFLLASLGVINSMFMSIYERIYELGVVKAIGTRPSSLILLVVSEAGLLALISCAFGMAVGGLASAWFSVNGIPLGEVEFSGVAFDRVKTSMVLHQFTNFPVYVIILTLLASLYPARFAARINPATALQRSL